MTKIVTMTAIDKPKFILELDSLFNEKWLIITLYDFYFPSLKFNVNNEAKITNIQGIDTLERHNYRNLLIGRHYFMTRDGESQLITPMTHEEHFTLVVAMPQVYRYYTFPGHCYAYFYQESTYVYHLIPSIFDDALLVC